MQNTIYSEWLNALPESDPLRKELLSIQDDPKEIEDGRTPRYYRSRNQPDEHLFRRQGYLRISGISAKTNYDAFNSLINYIISRLLLLFNNLSLIVKNITIILSDSTIKS